MGQSHNGTGSKTSGDSCIIPLVTLVPEPWQLPDFARLPLLNLSPSSGLRKAQLGNISASSVISHGLTWLTPKSVTNASEEPRWVSERVSYGVQEGLRRQGSISDFEVWCALQLCTLLGNNLHFRAETYYITKIWTECPKIYFVISHIFKLIY